MKDLTLVYVAKDEADMETFDASHVDRERVDLIGFANTAGLPLSTLANRVLSLTKTPVFGLCHHDAVFGPGALNAFTAEALSGAVCGIVGVDMDGVYRCCYKSGRDDRWASSIRADGPGHGPGPVSTLDGMAVFFRPDFGLRFDSVTFAGFHCHVEDLCLQAHAVGIPVTVPAADAHHRNHETPPEWLDGYRFYRARLSEKWKGTEFKTT